MADIPEQERTDYGNQWHAVARGMIHSGIRTRLERESERSASLDRKGRKRENDGTAMEGKRKDRKTCKGKRRLVSSPRMRVHNSFRERLLLYTVYSGEQKGPHMATRGLMYVIRRITL